MESVEDDAHATLTRKDSSVLELEYLELVSQLMSTESGEDLTKQVSDKPQQSSKKSGKRKSGSGIKISKKRRETVDGERGRSKKLEANGTKPRSSSTSSRNVVVKREDSKLDMFLTKQELREKQQKEQEELYRCFGVDLSLLLRKERERNQLQHDPSAVPLVVQLVVEEMRKRQMNEAEGIFRMSGHHATLTALKETFNTSGPEANVFANVDAFTLGDLLKAFFIQLPTPVVPRYAYVHLHAAAAHYINRPCAESMMDDVVLKVEYGERWRAFAAALIQSLPTSSKALLRFMLTFLSETALLTDKNRMSADSLGTVFAPGLLGSLFSTPSLPKALSPTVSAPNVSKQAVGKDKKRATDSKPPAEAISPQQMLTDILNKATLLSLLISDWPLISPIDSRPVTVYEATCSIVVSSKIEEYAASIGLPAFSIIKGDVFVVFGYTNPSHILVELRSVVGVIDIKALGFMTKIFFHDTEGLNLGVHLQPFEKCPMKRATKAVGKASDPTKTSKKHKRSRSSIASVLLH